MSKHLFFLALSVTLAFASGLIAEDKVPAINKSSKGLALKGYDPVAYFEASQALKGSAEFEYAWMEAKWHFTSARNRDLFAASPSRYAPQFGGYCAWAVSQGYTADTDPLAWKILDGRLYLNYNKSIQRKWEAGGAELIHAGERNWDRLSRKSGQ